MFRQPPVMGTGSLVTRFGHYLLMLLELQYHNDYCQITGGQFRKNTDIVSPTDQSRY